MKEIYIKNPDGDLCYDGEETNDPEFDGHLGALLRIVRYFIKGNH